MEIITIRLPPLTSWYEENNWARRSLADKALRKDGELIFIASLSFCMPHCEFIADNMDV